MDQMSGLGVILLNTIPIDRFQCRGLLQYLLARGLKILSDALQCRISFLGGLRYFGIKLDDSFTEFPEELVSFTVLRSFQEIFQVRFIGSDDSPHTVRRGLSGLFDAWAAAANRCRYEFRASEAC